MSTVQHIKASVKSTLFATSIYGQFFHPIVRAFKNLRGDIKNPQRFPPGHFYSPVPSIHEMQSDCTKIFDVFPRTFADIDLREQVQFEWLSEFKSYYKELPFSETKDTLRRYYYQNIVFTYSDAIFLFSMIKKLCPKRIIEIGSGFSSAAMLDTFNSLGIDVDLTCVEPHLERLDSLLLEGDRDKIHVIPKRVQDIDLCLFDDLDTNDILFIDSTHVVKTGSDVHHILFNILPRIRGGVYIHFHDIAFPFEYPKEWVFDGRSWNEAYFLRAFLAHNTRYEIVLFVTFLEHFYEPFFREHMPLCLKNRGGSLWLRKKGGNEQLPASSSQIS